MKTIIPEPTVSLGKLFLDEKNGMLGIGTTEHYNSKKCEWYKLADVNEMALYCINPRATIDNRVRVDCCFECDVPGKHIKRIVKTRIYCKHQTFDSTHEQWEEPGVISLMRSMITQAYINLTTYEVAAYRAYLVYTENTIKKQALCAFMLTEQYTREQIDTRYQTLRSALMNEKAYDDISLLDKYYEVLTDEKT